MTLWYLQGVAINFVKSDDIRILRDIEQYYSTQVDEMVSILIAPSLIMSAELVATCAAAFFRSLVNVIRLLCLCLS